MLTWICNCVYRATSSNINLTLQLKIDWPKSGAYLGPLRSCQYSNDSKSAHTLEQPPAESMGRFFVLCTLCVHVFIHCLALLLY